MQRSQASDHTNLTIIQIVDFFIGYTATDKNKIYIDEQSGKIKIASHIIFDEAHMSTKASKAPPAVQTLQRLG
jgi:hypothetical protein